jgi:hypothetical protein
MGQRWRIEIGLRIRGGGVQLDTVASREKYGLMIGMGHSPGGQGIARLFGRECKPFADRQA